MNEKIKNYIIGFLIILSVALFAYITSGNSKIDDYQTVIRQLTGELESAEKEATELRDYVNSAKRGINSAVGIIEQVQTSSTEITGGLTGSIEEIGIIIQLLEQFQEAFSRLGKEIFKLKNL
jgi:uncharacterized protein YoxC